MKQSNTVRYAVAALVRLANRDPSPVAHADGLARAAGVPRGSLPRVLTRLVRGRVLASLPGRLGGYMLARPARSITLLDVVEAVEGPVGPVAQSGKPLPTDARLLEALTRASEAYRRRLRSVTLADLAGGRDGRRRKGER